MEKIALVTYFVFLISFVMFRANHVPERSLERAIITFLVLCLITLIIMYEQSYYVSSQVKGVKLWRAAIGQDARQ